jgi:hypothetical protein
MRCSHFHKRPNITIVGPSCTLWAIAHVPPLDDPTLRLLPCHVIKLPGCPGLIKLCANLISYLPGGPHTSQQPDRAQILALHMTVAHNMTAITLLVPTTTQAIKCGQPETLGTYTGP